MKEDIVRPPKAEEVIEWSDEETEQFIEFYKQMTSSGITYRDRNLKELNYKRICEILPARSQEVVKRLWLILKTILHREIKKRRTAKLNRRRNLAHQKAKLLFRHSEKFFTRDAVSDF